MSNDKLALRIERLESCVEKLESRLQEISEILQYVCNESEELRAFAYDLREQK